MGDWRIKVNCGIYNKKIKYKVINGFFYLSSAQQVSSAAINEKVDGKSVNR